MFDTIFPLFLPSLALHLLSSVFLFACKYRRSWDMFLWDPYMKFNACFSSGESTTFGNKTLREYFYEAKWCPNPQPPCDVSMLSHSIPKHERCVVGCFLVEEEKFMIFVFINLIKSFRFYKQTSLLTMPECFHKAHWLKWNVLLVPLSFVHSYILHCWSRAIWAKAQLKCFTHNKNDINGFSVNILFPLSSLPFMCLYISFSPSCTRLAPFLGSHDGNIRMLGGNTCQNFTLYPKNRVCLFWKVNARRLVLVVWMM